MDLSKLLADPSAFRAELRVRHGAATLAESLVPFQTEMLALLDPCLVSISNGEKPPRRGMYVEWTKGSAKTTLAGQALLWLLLASRRQLEMRCGAGKLEQAAEVRQVIRDLLRDNS